MDVSFGHLFVHVQDLRRTRDFYVDVLGLDVLVDEIGYLRIGSPGGFHIGFEERGAAEVGAPGIEIDLISSDVDAMVERLRDAGIETTTPSDQPWGARHCWLHDPDGYRLSIYSPIASSAGGH